MKVLGIIGAALIITASIFSAIVFLTPESKAQGTPHEIIKIIGNENFTQMAADENWSGDGSEADPFIIEDYEINVTRNYGIELDSTDLHFIIRNSTFRKGGGRYWKAIYLKNVQNGAIINCTFEENSYNIFLNHSNGNRITGNTFLSRYDDGIYLNHSHENIISENYLEGLDNGIILHESQQNVISENNFHDIRYDDIQLKYSTSNEITYNNITEGIYLDFSDSNIISFNYLSPSYDGITIDSSVGNVISDNIMNNSGIILKGDEVRYWNENQIDVSNKINGRPVYFMKDQNGGSVPLNAGQIVLANCSNVIVEEQIISNCSIGIQIGFSSNISIYNNNLSSSYRTGVYLFQSHENNIFNNSIFEIGYGIYLVESNLNEIMNNNITSTEYGIRIMKSNFSYIADNKITSLNWWSIGLIFSKYNELVNNSMINDGITFWSENVEDYTTNTISTSNTVNGLPVYFWKSRNGGTVPLGAGQVILANCTNVIIENQGIDNASCGIQLHYSNNNYIRDNNITNSRYGIELWNSNENEISNNSIYSNFEGIVIYDSNENQFTNNTLFSKTFGIDLYNSSYNNIIGSWFFYNNWTFYIWGSSSNNIRENNIYSNYRRAFYMSTSNFTTISDNVITDNVGGIVLDRSYENIISNNYVVNNSYGIALDSSHNNTVTNNVASENSGDGIRLFRSKDNIIKDNIVNSNEEDGISLDQSIGNTLTQNSMEGNGIFISGRDQEYWDTHTIDSSNQVNGKTVYYWKNRNGGIIPHNAGEVILANCSNVSVTNLVITNSTAGIEIGFSSNITIANNTLNENRYGIFVRSSHWNNISKNDVSNNYYGIYLDGYSVRNRENKISGNIVSENYYGFYLYRSRYNNIIANNITANEIGIFMKSSLINIFHHNNIVDNLEQLNTTSWSNTWDNEGGEGNFWSDYNGSDLNGDGIGDTLTPHQEVDDNPLMEPADITREYAVSEREEPQIQNDIPPYRPSPLAMAVIMVILIIMIVFLTSPLKKRKKKKSESPPLGWNMHGFGLDVEKKEEEQDLIKEEDQHDLEGEDKLSGLDDEEEQIKDEMEHEEIEEINEVDQTKKDQ